MIIKVKDARRFIIFYEGTLNEITRRRTVGDAKALIEDFEKEDKEFGEYKPFSYGIYDSLKKCIVR